MDYSFITNGPTESFGMVKWIKVYLQGLGVSDEHAAKALLIPLPTYRAIRRDTQTGKPIVMCQGYTKDRGRLIQRIAERGFELTLQLNITGEELLAVEVDDGTPLLEAMIHDIALLERAANCMTAAFFRSKMRTIDD